jgi:integrase
MTSTPDYYRRFVDSIQGSKQTQIKYKIEFGYYLKDLKIDDPNTLISPDLADSPRKIRQIEDQLIDYVAYLQKVKKYTNGTIYVRLAAIFHFYLINRININKRYVSKFVGPNKRARKDQAYTHDQILTVLNSSTLRVRVIILLLASTGMRVGALHSLELCHLEKKALKNNICIKL